MRIVDHALRQLFEKYTAWIMKFFAEEGRSTATALRMTLSKFGGLNSFSVDLLFRNLLAGSHFLPLASALG